MINFPFGTNGKLIILGVPILKHITVTKEYKKIEHVRYFFFIYFRIILLTYNHECYAFLQTPPLNKNTPTFVLDIQN